MVKDAKKYAVTGSWKYAQFTTANPSSAPPALRSCFDCHEAVKDRDYVFTRYAH
jgi:cytochrome P460